VRALYLDLVDYLAIAAEVTGLDVGTLSRVTQLNWRTRPSTPLRPWGEEDLYPDFVDKRQSWSSGSPRTTRYRTATSGRPGWR